MFMFTVACLFLPLFAASGATQQVNSGFQQEEAEEQAQCENTGTEMQPAPYERKFENTATRKQPAPPESHNENWMKKIH